ncbi:hypothetical protein QJS10_CPB11g01535 [Acorus calamus]|uniref:CCHC-type domain-containing protein n=1 Tax=Acorus calamus TaxID=4465 RepID=A0AAV9DTE3_ACOCL|nr:hypothetical protein QJS10_CPB11g01535 [Acorus calamus]
MAECGDEAISVDIQSKRTVVAGSREYGGVSDAEGGSWTVVHRHKRGRGRETSKGALQWIGHRVGRQLLTGPRWGVFARQGVPNGWGNPFAFDVWGVGIWPLFVVTCWKCGGWGHRSPQCGGAHGSSRGSPGSSGAPARTTRPAGETPLPLVQVEWSEDVAARVRNLCSSIIATWEGEDDLSSKEIMVLLRSRWKGIDFRSSWGICKRKVIIRIPSSVAREFILNEERLSVVGGCIRFCKCDFSNGVLKEAGGEVDILLKGIPLVWRTEGTLRNIISPFAFLMSFSEVFDSEEEFPPVRASVWVNCERSIPQAVRANFGGWEALIKVALVGHREILSFAEVVRSGNRGPVFNRLGPMISGVVEVTPKRAGGQFTTEEKGKAVALDCVPSVLGLPSDGVANPKVMRTGTDVSPSGCASPALSLWSPNEILSDEEIEEFLGMEARSTEDLTDSDDSQVRETLEFRDSPSCSKALKMGIRFDLDNTEESFRARTASAFPVAPEEAGCSSGDPKPSV